MATKTIRYTEGDDTFDAVITLPSESGPRPAVIVCHAWSGRDELVEEKAAKLAELGYVGAAIDLYGIGKRGTDMASSSALMTALVEEPARLRRRLTAAYEAVAALDDVDANRMAAIGYCFGGLCAILSARMGLGLRGIVSLHGLLKIGEQLDNDVQAKILVLHGQDDPMAPPADIGAFAEEMKRINADWQLHAYPGVMHAFTNPKANDPGFGAVYNEDADHRSHSEMTRFLEEVLA